MVRFMSVKKAAEELDLKEVTIREWIRERRIAVVRLGRTVKVPVEEIERLIQLGTVPARASRHV